MGSALMDSAPESLDDYVGREVDRAWSPPPALVLGHDDLIRRAKEALRDSLARLGALPRDDPFWAGSNGRATIHKLADFARRLLRDDPGDERALWCAAALAIRHCSNDFGAAGWVGLARLGRLGARWPIGAAHFVWAASGVDTSEALVCLLRERVPRARAVGALSQLRSAPGLPTASAQWLDAVLGELAA